MDNIDLVRATWAYRVALWGSAPEGQQTVLPSGILPELPVLTRLTVEFKEDGSPTYSIQHDNPAE